MIKMTSNTTTRRMLLLMVPSLLLSLALLLLLLLPPPSSSSSSVEAWVLLPAAPGRTTPPLLHLRRTRRHVNINSQLPMLLSSPSRYSSSSCDIPKGRSRRRIGYNHLTTATTTTTSSTSLHMALIPLPSEDVLQLLDVSTSPTGKQYAVYWGTTKRDRYNRLLESSIIGFVGVFFCYFLSFVLGGFVSTAVGTLFGFWAVLSPDLKARQRNWEFLGGRPIIDTPPPPAQTTKGLRSLPPSYDDDYDYADETSNNNNFMNTNTEGLYGSLFLGSVKDVCVVEDTTSIEEYDLDDFQDYSVEDDELEQIIGTPYLLRMKVSDHKTGGSRELQVHARLKEEYLGITEGMAVTAVLLSTSRSFANLAALSDIYVVDERCSVGDYPYLNQVEMEALLEEDDEIWNLLQDEVIVEEGIVFDDDEETYTDDYDDDDYDDDNDRDDRSKVMVRRQRRR